MEKNNEKGKNIVIGILIGVIVCLVIALIFVSYNKFIGKDENKKSNSINNNSAETDDNKNNAVDNNNDTITLDEIKNRFEVKDQGNDMDNRGIYYESIYDKEKQKTIISNLKDMGAGNLYFLLNNKKGYIYIENNISCPNNNSRLYDLNGKIIFNIPDKKKFSIITEKEPPFGISYFEVNGVYYAEDGKINKYNLDGTKVSNSKKYDEVIEVGHYYSLIYNKNDNYIYVVSNDSTYSKKIAEKVSTYTYSLYHNVTDNIVSISLIPINLHCALNTGPLDQYILNLNNNTLTFEKSY